MEEFKKLLLATAMAGTLFTGSVYAATGTSVAGGTITFNGAVSDTTCNVTTNSGSDFTVNVSPVTKEDMGTTPGVIGSSATPFTITVSGCSGFDDASTAAQSLNIVFTGANVSDDMNYLKNESGSAEGVGIAITKNGSDLVKMNEALATGLATSQSAASGNYDTAAAGDINLYAHYYNYGGSNVSTGSVVTTATYTFSYE
ncbi:major type 1 subunit fimbrin (pilin) [Erwinia persicina]|jgi:major type 1 subunit fimbrin (pilin)|uniref:Fimbrial protein n=1 Tax=Erwinia plantamica TaxID=3237104 RepID=A0ABW7CMA3_9GAMM|nr:MULTISPECIES: fimbrial protein [Erwinia]MCP1437643.1 major type 1 subunit fimbrin (pilin) [Erwinia persicina]MDN4626554.1 fimbrial protein [Erwinia sp. PsM31]MDN8541009.1 fimbrial protein [Erwinia sp. BC051422]